MPSSADHAVQDCHKQRRHGKERFATSRDQRGKGRQQCNDQVRKSGSSSRLAGDTSLTVKTPPRGPRHKPTYSSSSESVDHIDNWRRKSDEQKAVEKEMKRQMQKKVHAEPQKSGKKGRGKEKRDDKREETKGGRSQMQRGSKASRHVDDESRVIRVKGRITKRIGRRKSDGTTKSLKESPTTPNPALMGKDLHMQTNMKVIFISFRVRPDSEEKRASNGLTILTSSHHRWMMVMLISASTRHLLTGQKFPASRTFRISFKAVTSWAFICQITTTNVSKRMTEFL